MFQAMASVNAFGNPAKVIACIGLLMCSLPVPVHSSSDSDEPLVVDAKLLIELAGMHEEQLEELRSGRVVTIKAPGNVSIDVNEFDIYSGFAIVIKAKTKTVGKVVGRPEWAGAGIPGAVAIFIEDKSEFPRVKFSEGDSNEIKRILKGRDEVNLSKAELQDLNDLGLTSRYDTDELERFSAEYRKILHARYENYRERGLDGIPPYEDGRDSWLPSEHFRLVNSYWDAWLPKVVPEYAGELSQAPSEIDPIVNQDFLLVRKTIGDRPIYSLAHRFGRVSDNLIVAVHREFFVSGTYGAMQIVFLGIPYEGGTLLLLGTDAFTEKVAGFASGIKHNVGRGMMGDVMTGMLLELRAQAEQVELLD
jgi:hypothetical protein